MKKLIVAATVSLLLLSSALAQQSFWDLYYKGSFDQISKEIAAGANVNLAEIETGYTPLMAAINNDPKIAVDLAKLLIKAGADVKAKNKDGRTALDDVISNPSIPGEIIKLLAEAGADVNAADKYGITPLITAAGKGNTTAVCALLEAGASANARCTIDGGTPIIRAAQFSDDTSEIVLALLKYGAKVDDQDSSGATPLMYAAQRGYSKVVKTLIDNKASVAIRDSTFEYTALMFAALGRNDVISKDPYEVVRLLLAAGAKKTDKDYFGSTAYAIALKAHFGESYYSEAIGLLKP